MMEELKNEVISKVRSCLISTKGQVTLKQLEDDYRTLLGERIPYMKLGFRNLESFLRSVPSITVYELPSGQILVDAKISEKSAHISSMISKQKVKKRTVRMTPHTPHRFNRTRFQPPPAANKWRPKKAGGGATSSFPRMENNRVTAVHNQFINYPKPTVPSKVVVPERKPTPPPPQPQENRSNSIWQNGNKENQSYNKENQSYNKENQNYNKVTETNGIQNNYESKDGESSSPLTTVTKKMRSQWMNELTLDRDSGNSSPTTEYAASYKPFVEEFTRTGDVIQDLKNAATFYKLGDIEVKISERKTNKRSKVVQYDCVIKVGGLHSYRSYPLDFYKKEDAELHTSKIALDDLIPRYSRRKSLLISSNEDVFERVPPMLEKHQGAVWMWQIEYEYIEKYNEQLPSDWLSVIDNSLHVSIEKCTGGYVLRHCNPDDVLQKGKKLDISLNVDAVSIPCNTVQFNDNNQLEALVTAALSCNEVWCQHYGTPEYDKFIEMSETMEQYYSENKNVLLAKQVSYGNCYVIFHDENWYRVRTLSIPEEGYVDCFLIDYGVEVRVPVNSIYALKRIFAIVPAQAFLCRLVGLEELYDASVDSPHIQDLVNREFILEMIVDEAGCSTDVSIPVVIYDLETNASINEKLILSLTIDAAMPVLDKNAITEVYVSHIEKEDVYVQVLSRSFLGLMEMLQKLEKNVASCPPTHLLEPITKENSVNRLYLAKCKLSNRWKRATIVEWSTDRRCATMAQIYFVDYGNFSIIDAAKETMFPLDKLEEDVSRYPPQAVKVRIMLDKIPNGFVARATKLMPPDQKILLKIITYDTEQVPWVEFFKRSSDGGLFCINKSIAVETELQNIDESNNNDKTAKKRLINLAQFNDNTKNVPSGGSLKKPNLPKKDDTYFVNIPFSVNPWNFFIQPLATLDELTALMTDMQERYKTIEFSPLQLDDVIPGKIYASKHEDGRWYRTSVLKVIHSGSISVFYCDFGYYTSLTLAQLVPLDLKFMNLPYQALKAKMSGIKPIKNKWTVEDCDIFNSLVTKKQFAAVLVNIEKDELYRSDIVLELILIDVSTDDDIFIKDLLIEKGIAKSV